MRLERSDIEFPMWRKKVDAALFKHNYTPIPKFLWTIWSIEKLFEFCRDKDNTDAQVRIRYEDIIYEGRILHSPSKIMYRLFFPENLGQRLSKNYVMSYIRSVEYDLRKGKLEYEDVDLEEEIPFWEFLDIEFDSDSKLFIFKSYYTQKIISLERFIEYNKSKKL